MDEKTPISSIGEQVKLPHGPYIWTQYATHFLKEC